MVSDAQGVKAEITKRVNEKKSEVSNQYHRLVGTKMLERSTPLLFSPELPSHCTSPLDLSPRWGPVDSPLLSSCGLAQQLNMILRLISSPFAPTAIVCCSSVGCSWGSRLVSHSAFYSASPVHQFTCSCSYLSSLTLCLTCLHALGSSATPVNACPSSFHMLTTQMPPIVHTHHCVV